MDYECEVYFQAFADGVAPKTCVGYRFYGSSFITRGRIFRGGLAALWAAMEIRRLHSSRRDQEHLAQGRESDELPWVSAQ